MNSPSDRGVGLHSEGLLDREFTRRTRAALLPVDDAEQVAATRTVLESSDGPAPRHLDPALLDRAATIV